MQEKKFDQKAYKNKWRKEKKSQINFEINPDEKEEFEELLKKHNLKKIQFFRNAVEELKKK